MKYGVPDARQALACDGRSHVGLIRPENEDSFGLAADQGVLVVADGMGGYKNGRYVADRTVDAVCQVVPAADLDGTLERANDALIHTNQEIWRRSQETGTKMGATFVAALVDRRRVGILWAGDSRAYLLRDDNLYCLTRDHSAVRQLIDSGSIGLFESFNHPMRHVVVRALGMTEELRIDSSRHAVLPGDILLLSTDGLHGAVCDDVIERCLSQHGVDALDPLIALALDAGGGDNVTAVLMRF
jgi:serine/threonine protein phosphatase Stp1